MGTRNYLIPDSILTEEMKEGYRKRALLAGYKRALEKTIGDMSEMSKLMNPSIPFPDRVPTSVDQRELELIRDCGCALDQWNTAPLAAIGTPYSIFQAIAAPAGALRANSLVVYYNIKIATVPMPISRILFRNTNATGNITYQFDVEQLEEYPVWVGWFSEPVVWDPNLPYAAQVLSRAATGVLARAKLGNFVFEPGGTTTA